MSLRPRNASRACIRSASLRGPRSTISLYTASDLPAVAAVYDRRFFFRQKPPLIERRYTEVLKGHDLRGGFLAALFLEEHVVRGAGIKRRVEVDQVNARVLDVVSKDFQVVAEIKLVLGVHDGVAAVYDRRLFFR